jgi:hypothetical protein
MRLVQAGVVTVTISLLSAGWAAGACTVGRCRDEGAVAAVRAEVAARCDCAAATSHAEYVSCAKGVIKDAVAGGRLPRSCKKPVGKCETRSTCGISKATICCSKKGTKVKARLMKRAASCAGSTCSSPMALVDACTPQAACATRPDLPASTTITTTTSPPTTNTTTTGPATTNTTTTVPVNTGSPFRSIQQVFQTSCAFSACHSALGRQGGLVLDHEDVSYAALVDQPAAHPDAHAAGMLRVESGDPGNSYLVRKLRGLGPGERMPQGYPPLSEATIAMIEGWIARGAHSTAEECPAIVESTAIPQHAGTVHTICDPPPPPGDYVWQPQPPLEAPAPGKGIQLYVPPRDVVPGTEWETCYAFRPDWQAISQQVGMPAGSLPFFKKQEYRMHDGSHHLLLYGYFGDFPDAWADGFFPCFAASCLNPGDCPIDSDKILPIGGTQVAGTRYEVAYPPGVGIPVLGPNNVLIVNLHYTNPFQPPQPIYGEAWLNLHFYAPGEFKVLLDGIFAVNYADMFVEPYETRTISRIWQPRSLLFGTTPNAAVFQVFGHMHKRGELFEIDYVRGGKCSGNNALCGRDGDCRPGQTCVRGANFEDTNIYRAVAWDHAPVTDFPPPYLWVDKDQGLRWTCTHTNGYLGDPLRPPKRCHEGCNTCGWDAATRTCIFTRGVQLGFHTSVRTYQEGEPIPLVFGELADDDMCNMFGYFIDRAALPLIGP